MAAVAVSKARTATSGDLHRARVGARVGEPHAAHAAAGQLGRGRVGPLDERDRVRGQVVLEQAGVLGLEVAAEAEEVEVGDRNPAVVAARRW